MTATDPADWTVTEARSALAGGECSVPEYVDALLERADRAERLHALIDFDPAALRAAAAAPSDMTGALAGIPFARKDVFDVAGEPTTGGCTALRDNLAPATAPIVTRLLEAGALLGPRTNLHELSMGVTSNNVAFGPVLNPYDDSRVAGGSSGGAAVAVAVGLTPFALGADTGGSVRIPAAYCGVVGFRPTPGRYSADGVLPLSPSRDTPGILARSVADVQLIDATLATTTRSVARGLDGVALAYLADLGASSSAAVRAATAQAIERLRAAGASVVEVEARPIVAAANAAGPRIALSEWRAALADALGNRFDADAITAALQSPDVQKAWHVAAKFAADRDAYRDAMAARHAAAEAWTALLRQGEVAALLYPTSSIVAPPLADATTTERDGEQVDTFWAISEFASVAGVLGAPALSLPIGRSPAGLPIGLDVAGAASDDAALLDHAAAIEAALRDEEAA